MKIAVGCDHGGFELKQAVMQFLQDNGYEYQDFGTYDTQFLQIIPMLLLPVAKAVPPGEFDQRHFNLRHRHRHWHCSQ